ncbi:MAG TPA: alpha/beta hydrolase [Chitinophagales bacterium]|nr:alpha/beta hydrolase [Chitinophagales bacterium]
MEMIFIGVLLIIIAFLSAILVFRPSQILTKEFVKSKIETPHSKFFQWKDNEIHYTDEGSGQVILMVHGLGGSFYNFQALTPLFTAEYRVIRVDIPGMGLSDFNISKKDTDFLEEYTEFFQTFVAHLEINTFHIMGNSLGGMISWVTSTVMPEKVESLTLINSAGYDVKKVLKSAAGPIRWKWFSPVVTKGLPRKITNHMLARPFADKSKVDPNELEFTYWNLNRKGNINTLTSLATSGQNPDEALIKNIQCPTLIIWGQEDIIIPVAHAYRFNNDIPNSEVKIYSPCGHMAMMEFPEKVANDFRNFIKERIA